MPLRSLCLASCVICLGCQSAPPGARQDQQPPIGASVKAQERPNAKLDPQVVAERLWDLGQLAAQEGNLAKAVQHYRQSLTVSPALTRNHLSLAAAYLEMGQDQKACDHRGRHVAAN